MQAIPITLAPASVASALLHSAERGQVDSLEDELAHARAALDKGIRRNRDSRQEEMRDLLEALTGELSGRVRVCRRRGEEQWAPGTFPMYLLRHVARASEPARARRATSPSRARDVRR